MALDEVLRDSLINSRPGVLDNEAQVKLTVIQPVLNELGWRATNPAEFKSEFPVDNRWVDYALGTQLTTPFPRPLVFVEAKDVGRADTKGEEQLFSYAVNRGIPLLVLTDGKVWNFYLSMAAGQPPDRRFYQIELTREEMIPAYAELFRRYLQKDNVLSGQARRDGEEQLERTQESELARNQIAHCWDALLSEPSPILRDALVEAVEKRCGAKPAAEDVDGFLRGLRATAVPSVRPSPEISATPSARTAPSGRRSRSNKPAEQTGRTGRIVGYVLDGREVAARSGIRVLQEILLEFDRRDAAFMERFALETGTARRNIVGRNRESIYMSSPHLIDQSQEVGNGWWMSTKINAVQIKGHIETACRLAGVRFGSQLRLIERQDTRTV